MGAHGTSLGQEGHIINILPPTTAFSIDGLYSDIFHMKEAAHASIIITTGTMTSSTTFTLYESATSGGTSTTVLGTTAGINYKAVATAASDTFTAPAAFTVAGLTTGSTNDLTWVIEVDSQDLTDGYPYMRLQFTSTAACQVSAIAVLTGLRYSEDINLSAID